MPSVKHASTSTKADTALQERVNSFLTCLIQQLKKPKSLPCNHNFCTKCLASIKNKKSCPVCRGKNKEQTSKKAPKELLDLLKAVDKDMGSEKVEELVAKGQGYACGPTSKKHVVCGFPTWPMFLACG